MWAGSKWATKPRPHYPAIDAAVAAAAGGPTNPAGWDHTWALPLGAVFALAAAVSLSRDWRRLSRQHSYRKEKHPYDGQ